MGAPDATSSDPVLAGGGVYETRVPVSAVMLALPQTEVGLLPLVLQMIAVITLAACLIWLPMVFPACIEEIICDWFKLLSNP